MLAKRLANLPKFYNDRLSLKHTKLTNLQDYHKKLNELNAEIIDLKNFKQELKKQTSSSSLELQEIRDEIKVTESNLEEIRYEFIDYLESDILTTVEENSEFGRSGLVLKGCELNVRGLIGGAESDIFAKSLSESYHNYATNVYDKSNWQFRTDHSVSQKRTRLAQPNKIYSIKIEDDEVSVFDDFWMESGLHVLKTQELRNTEQATKQRGTGSFTFTAQVSTKPYFSGTLKTGIFAESQQAVCDYILNSKDFEISENLKKVTEVKRLIPITYKPLGMNFEVNHLNSQARKDSIFLESFEIQNKIASELFKQHQDTIFGKQLYTNNSEKVRQYSEINNFVSDYRLDSEDIWRGAVDEFLSGGNYLSSFISKLKEVDPAREHKLNHLFNKMYG